MYQQLITPNYNVPYVGGLCEGFVEGTIGVASAPYVTQSGPNKGKWTTDGVFPSAIDAWNSNMANHPNELPPMEIRVPIYLTINGVPAGHVAIWIGDGRVASSTQSGYHNTAYVHPSLQDLINVYTKTHGGMVYLGWSEYIGRKRIVGGQVQATLTTDDDVAEVFRLWAHREPSTEEIKTFKGKFFTDVAKYLRSNADKDGVTKVWDWGTRSVNENWPQQMTDMQTKIKELESTTKYVLVTDKLYKEKS